MTSCMGLTAPRVHMGYPVATQPAGSVQQEPGTAISNLEYLQSHFTVWVNQDEGGILLWECVARNETLKVP